MWDVEVKFCSLDREPIHHPVIIHVGSNFAVMEGPEWTTKDGWLNCMWCGTEFTKAFTYWCYLMYKNDEWKLYDRIDKETYDIKNTDLYDTLNIYYSHN